MSDTKILLQFEDIKVPYIARELFFIGKTFDELFSIENFGNNNDTFLNPKVNALDIIPIPFIKKTFDDYIQLRKTIFIQGVITNFCTVELYQLECYLQVYKNIFNINGLIESCKTLQISLINLEWDHLEKIILNNKCNGEFISKYYNDISQNILLRGIDLTSIPIIVFQKIGLYLLLHIFTSEYSDHSEKYSTQCTNLFTKYINDTEFNNEYIPDIGSLISILPLVDEIMNTIIIYKVIHQQ